MTAVYILDGYYWYVILDRLVEDLLGNAPTLTFIAAVLVMPECICRASRSSVVYARTSI